MSISFRIKSHTETSGVEVVEIIENEMVVGVIYPTEKGIKLVSAHIEEVVDDRKPVDWPPIPAVLVTFNPGPYEIRGNELVKLPVH